MVKAIKAIKVMEVYKSVFLQLSESTKQFYMEVYNSGFVFSGSLPASGKIYIRLKPASLIKLLKSLMIFSISVLNELSLCDGKVI